MAEERVPASDAARVSGAARLLRQRTEMGERELFLGVLGREEVLRRAAEARRVAAEPPRPSIAGADGAGDGPGSREGSPPITSGRDAPPGDGSRVAPSGAPSPLPDVYDAVRDAALACTRCRLSEGRTQVVFSDGSPDARLVVVGEAPGANEDQTGIPFVGAAGKFLDLLLATVDLSREESVYICNVLKCRPPGNRNPMPDEIEACAPFLRKQLELIRPGALLAVGSFSAQLLTGREGIALGKLRGEVHSYQGVPLVCTYHPAALLRNPKWTRAFWDDLQLLRTILDGA